MNKNYASLSEKTKDTLKELVFSSFKINDEEQITDELITEFLDYLVDNFEAPLIEDEESGKPIDRNLLTRVSDAITEIGFLNI